eukprot:1227303-Rhodomonas_salina.3
MAPVPPPLPPSSSPSDEVLMWSYASAQRCARMAGPVHTGDEDSAPDPQGESLGAYAYLAAQQVLRCAYSPSRTAPTSKLPSTFAVAASLY